VAVQTTIAADHVERVLLSGAASVDGLKGGPLLDVIAASAPSPRKAIKAWRLRYRFGQTIVHQPVAGTSRVVAPCGAAGASKCRGCTELTEELVRAAAERGEQDRDPAWFIPLAIVLRGTVEVHMPAEAPTRHLRTRPLRVVEPGEAFGLFELGDELIDQEPAAEDSPWAVTAGLRSLILSAPHNNTGLGRLIVAALDAEAGVRLGQKTRRALEGGGSGPPDEVIADALPHIAGALAKEPTVEVLIIPDLREAVRHSPALEAALFRLAWTQSLHTRRTLLHYENAERDGRVRRADPYHYRTVAYLRGILERTVPAWAPAAYLSHVEPLQLLGRLLRNVKHRDWRDLEPLVFAPGYLKMTPNPMPFAIYSFEYPLVGGAVPPEKRGQSDLDMCLKITALPTKSHERLRQVAHWLSKSDVKDGTETRAMVINRLTRLCAPNRTIRWNAPLFNQWLALAYNEQ
jgi:hypothetical protein